MSYDRVLKIAEAEVGYLEKKSNSQLDDKTANAGSNNWTKYGRDLIKEIGSPYSNGCAWCDMFTDWCFIKAYGKERAKELLGGWSAYTPTSAQYFKNMGQWYTNNPKIGDVIFFKNTTRICHTGIVYNVDSQKVYTIEGNTSGASGVIANGGGVCKKSYALSYANIAGYGRPKYNTSVTTTVTSTATAKTTKAIDVSSYQGNIDWTKVKQSGVDYAILRGVLKNGTLDSTFEKNYTNAIKAGVKILGVYHFSYALSENDAVSAATNMVQKLGGKKIDIWEDLEWDEQRKLGKDKVTAIAKAYVNTCKKLGYTCHIYSNLDWYKNVYNAAELKALGCKFWIARYPVQDNGTVKDSLKPNVGEIIWQYSSKGSVSGISGDVDMNLVYSDVPKAATVTPVVTLTTIPIAKGKVYNCTKLNIRKEPKVEANNIMAVLVSGTEVTIMGKADNGWYKVKIKDNLVGYVSNKYIAVT
ncbi:MAG: SH3 domain-containing protein [Ruminococcus flavefaciens]|nr:SH3 domain-containing protein [Ruminococcus flavefaciens]